MSVIGLSRCLVTSLDKRSLHRCSMIIIPRLLLIYDPQIINTIPSDIRDLHQDSNTTYTTVILDLALFHAKRSGS